VEAPLLVSDAGAVVTLLNWGAPMAAALQVNVSGLEFVPSRVASAEHGSLDHKTEAGAISVSLHLGAADFLMFFK
jgi:hypothetical protein